MNRWLVLLGTAFLFLVLGYSLPIAIQNPTSSNIVVTLVVGILAIVGFVSFFKGPKQARRQELQPIE